MLLKKQNCLTHVLKEMVLKNELLIISAQKVMSFLKYQKDNGNKFFQTNNAHQMTIIPILNFTRQVYPLSESTPVK